MFNKKSKEEDILNEFMLGDDEEREVRATYGRYEVYEANDEAIDYISNKMDECRKNKNNELLIDETEIMIDLFKMLTSLPESILNIDSFNKMQRKPHKIKKVFRNITKEVTDIVQEITDDITKEVHRVSKMSTPLQEAYLKRMKELSNKKEKTAEELEIEELKKQLAEKEAKLNKK